MPSEFLGSGCTGALDTGSWLVTAKHATFHQLRTGLRRGQQPYRDTPWHLPAQVGNGATSAETGNVWTCFARSNGFCNADSDYPIKAAFSPDGSHFVAGCSGSNAENSPHLGGASPLTVQALSGEHQALHTLGSRVSEICILAVQEVCASGRVCMTALRTCGSRTHLSSCRSTSRRDAP